MISAIQAMVARALWNQLPPGLDLEATGTSLFGQPWLYAFSAFVLGALHVLEPGHGKTIVGAYLVGTRGRTIDAVLLGLIVTLTHTAGVFALAVVALFASAYLVPQTLSRVLGIVGGLLIIAVGTAMVRSLRRPDRHYHGHDHGDAGGPTGHAHRDGDHGHHHHPSPNRPGLGALLTLGVSGGLVPCPAALVLLLAAMTNGAIAAGIGLVIAFSIGLAAVLVVIGIVLVHATRVARGRLFGARAARAAQAGSAVVVLTLGLVVTAQAIIGASPVPIP